MKAVEYTREELLKDSRKLYRNLSERLKRIRKIENAPEYALNRFRELQENYPRDIRELSDTELRKYHRQLKYIDQLKSSKIKNVQLIKEVWQPIEQRLNVMSERTRDKFWEIYKNVYGETGMGELFKYDVFDFIQTRMFFHGDDAEKIQNTIETLYGRLKKEMGNVGEEEFAIRFTDELYNISFDDI